MSIAHNTRVFIVATHNGTKYWLIKAENQRAPTGCLVLQGQWGSAAQAQPVTMELGAVYKRRFLEETNCSVQFTLSASDSAPYVAESNSSTPSEDTRPPLEAHRGFLVRSGINTRTGERAYFCHLYEGTRQLESIRGDSPDDVVNKVIENGQQDRAEKAPMTASAPQQAAPVRPAGPRLRPGSIR
jgi:hypothetical protein